MGLNMSTKDKIIQTSIVLFNMHGERAITTNHIASELGISPGNLYYHFKNKEDILRHIFSLYRGHLEAHFVPLSKDEDVLTQLAAYLDSLFELMWKFHFFYDNLADILGRDNELKADYLELQNKLTDQVCLVIKGLAHSDLIEIEELDIVELAHTVKLTVSFWTPYVKTHGASGELSQSDIYQGILKVISLFKPYATVLGREKFAQLQLQYSSLVAAEKVA